MVEEATKQPGVKMADALPPFRVKLEQCNWDRMSPAYWNYDVECACCGRPIKDRWKCKVVIWKGVNADGEHVFLPIKGNANLDRDPVEYGSFVGAHCAKKLPRAYKMGMKVACKNWEQWG
jgi:hypothetical protein